MICENRNEKKSCNIRNSTIEDPNVKWKSFLVKCNAFRSARPESKIAASSFTDREMTSRILDEGLESLSVTEKLRLRCFMAAAKKKKKKLLKEKIESGNRVSFPLSLIHNCYR